jgi:GxxExxY protein
MAFVATRVLYYNPATAPRGARGVHAAAAATTLLGCAMNGSENINKLTGAIIEAAYTVHRRLGPGLLEHAYRRCLTYEIGKAGLNAVAEVPLALQYDELLVETAYRLDILVEDMVIVEVKAVEKVLPVHHAQLLTYMKLGAKPVGQFLNFNAKRLSEGMKRMVNDL